MQKPPQPHTLSLALRPDAVQAVVPIARPDQREPMASHREAPIERTRAVFKERTGGFRDPRLEVRFVLSLRERVALQERYNFIEHAVIARRLDELQDGIGKPQQVVRNARAHSASRRRVPPVLNIALRELARGGTQELLMSDIARGHGERVTSCS